jgi:hypothetical protein
MSMEHYPEVRGDESGIVPPQSAPKAEWPKKIRTLSAVDLDRLTIDAEGRFYWDGNLVNYQPPKSETKPQDSFDRVALEVLDQAAHDIATHKPAEPAHSDQPEQIAAEPDQEARAEELRAVDQFTAVPPVVSDLRPSAAMASIGTYEYRAPAERVRVKLSGWQSLGAILLTLGFILGAAGIAAQGFVAAHDWSCRTGLTSRWCPKPPPAPTLPVRPEISN